MVLKINIRSFFSILISKTILFASKKFLNGGSNFPGKIALKIDKDILKIVAKNYKVILVTGTNGKTTTTSMIYNIIKNSGRSVITNSTGANMFPGITASFIDNYSFLSRKTERFAVIEVDEANLKFITNYITPCIITITNLFRDQLDRYGEVYTTLNKILEGVERTEQSTLVLNGDESLLGDLNLQNKVIYYGFKTFLEDNKVVDINADAKFCKKCKSPYHYNFITYNHLGDFFCPNCGYQRPELKYSVNKIEKLTPYNSSVVFNNQCIIINQPGTYNIYNGLCAYSICKELGISDDTIYDSLKEQSSHFGRQEKLYIGNKEVKIILVKNPAGYNQAIDTIAIDTRTLDIVFLLNDNYADGRDVSWIWDVNFEKLSSLNISELVAGGIRLYDMAVRLKVAGFDAPKIKVIEDYAGILENIKSSSSESIYILATYTAMIRFRKYLHSKKYIKKLW